MTDRKDTLECIEIDPAATPQRSVIWLHGLGADGSDFVPIVTELNLPPALGVRFVFPHAPIMPVTINNGYEMRAWFDIFSIAQSDRVDEEGILRTTLSIEKLIANEEARGIATKNIILAGFSQGAVIALMLGLTFKKSLAGIIALSGFLPFEKIQNKTTAANKEIPIFIAHGVSDPLVPFALGEATEMALKKAEYPVTWRAYKMPHSVCTEEINDIRQWITTIWNE